MNNLIKTIVLKQGPAILAPYSVGKIFNGLNPLTNELVSNCVEEQTDQILKNLESILKQAGSGLDRVLKCTVYLLTMDDFAKVNNIYAKYFKHEPPARVCIAVAQIPKGGKVQIDAIAVVDQPQTKQYNQPKGKL